MVPPGPTYTPSTRYGPAINFQHIEYTWLTVNQSIEKTPWTGSHTTVGLKSNINIGSVKSIENNVKERTIAVKYPNSFFLLLKSSCTYIVPIVNHRQGLYNETFILHLNDSPATPKKWLFDQLVNYIEHQPREDFERNVFANLMPSQVLIATKLSPSIFLTLPL